MEETNKIKGSVMWYQPHRGFGYIRGEDTKEYFVYHSEIQMEGFQKVLFVPD